MTVAAPSTLRAAAIGFAVASGVAGLLSGVQTFTLAMNGPVSLDVAMWIRAPALMSLSLMVVGIAGVTVWLDSRRGPSAAVAAVVAAVGVAMGSLWIASVMVRPGFSPAVVRLLACEVLVVLLLLGVARVWSQTVDGKISATEVALGAVVGVAASGLRDFVELATHLVRSHGDGAWSFTGLWVLAHGLLLVAAVLATLALTGRGPVAPVAILVIVAGVLTIVVVGRDVLSFRTFVGYGIHRTVIFASLGLLTRFFGALAVVGLGALLLWARTTGPVVDRPSGGDDTFARWQD